MELIQKIKNNKTGFLSELVIHFFVVIFQYFQIVFESHLNKLQKEVFEIVCDKESLNALNNFLDLKVAFQYWKYIVYNKIIVESKNFFHVFEHPTWFIYLISIVIFIYLLAIDEYIYNWFWDFIPKFGEERTNEKGRTCFLNDFPILELPWEFRLVLFLS